MKIKLKTPFSINPKNEKLCTPSLSLIIQGSVQKVTVSEALLALAEMNFADGEFSSAKRYFKEFSKGRGNLTAEQLWLAVRIERAVGDRNSEASYALQLSKQFPASREAQLLMSDE